MRRCNMAFVAFSLIVVLAGSAYGEQVVSPLYASWAKYKTGTNVKLSMATDVEGRQVKADTKMVLVELTAEKAVIESVITVNMNGQTINAPPKREELMKMGERESKNPSQIDAAKLEKAQQESVTVPAGTFDAKVIPVSGESNGVATEGKVWFSDQVPGGTVKMEMKSEAKKALVRVELTAIEKK